MPATDNDFDWNLNPSGAAVYSSRTIMLDPTTADGCFLGSLNAMCIGITPEQTEFASGQFGNQTPPQQLAQASDPNLPPGSVARVPVYGPCRNALATVDPAYGGQVRPNDLVISSNSGYIVRATPSGPWNQWIIGIARTFASAGQQCNVKIQIFPWSPTGS